MRSKGCLLLRILGISWVEHPLYSMSLILVMLCLLGKDLIEYILMLRKRLTVRWTLEKGIIKESVSPWSSSVVLVKKKDGSYRFCVDFRKVNKVTKVDSFPMSLVADALDSSLVQACFPRWISKADFGRYKCTRIHNTYSSLHKQWS